MMLDIYLISRHTCNVLLLDSLHCRTFLGPHPAETSHIVSQVLYSVQLCKNVDKLMFKGTHISPHTYAFRVLYVSDQLRVY